MWEPDKANSKGASLGPVVRFVTCLTRSSSLCWPGLASLTPLCLEIRGLGGELAQIYFGTLRTEYFSAQTSWGMQICDDPGCRGCSGELPRRERCESRNLGVALLTAANCHIRSVLCLFFFLPLASNHTFCASASTEVPDPPH